MPSNMLRNWIKKLGDKLAANGSRRSRRQRSGTANRRATVKPMLETLESRLVPSNVVTSSADTNTAGTLLYAINNAVQGADLGATITFNPTLTGGNTITVTSPLTIASGDSGITIQGLGAGNLFISGGTTSEVFVVNGGVTASISSLTVENGKISGNGGGIVNDGTLNLSNDTISGNTQTGASSGGGIYNVGSVGLTNCIISGNSAALYGAGIASTGTLTVTNCTISGNTAGDSAGGIEVYGGTATISNSYFTTNHAVISGGGVVAYAGATTLSNDTFYGNSAEKGGAVEVYGGTATLNYDTLSGNTATVTGGGGLFIGNASATMLDSIVAGNTGTDPDVDGTVWAQYDMIGVNTGMSFATGSGGTGVNQSAGSSWLITPPALNGGLTPNLAILSTSPAINAGEVLGTITTDQRGFSRPAATPDVGAFQLQTVTASSALLPATSTSITIGGADFDTTAANDSVTFSNGVTGSVTAATSTSLTVSLTGLSSLTGGTALSATVTVDGVSSGTGVQVAKVEPVVSTSTGNLAANAISLTITGFGFDTNTGNDTVTFSNGVTGSVTAATSSSLTVSLAGLSAVATGTALSATVTVDGVSNGSSVQVAKVIPGVTASSANIADSSTTITINGAGFSTTTTSDTVTFTLGVVGTVTSATATQLVVAITTPPTLPFATDPLTATVTVGGTSSGTAVQVATETAGTWTVTDSNGASGSGSMTDVTLPFAVAHAQNGDTINFASSLVSGNTITLNTALSINHNITITGQGAANTIISGGGAVVDFDIIVTTVSMSSLTIENGFAGTTGNGGGINVSSSNLTLTNSIVSGNKAGNSGGGIFTASGSGTVTLSNDTISGNSADYGGGVLDYGPMTIIGSTISNNTAGSTAGGVEVYNGSLKLSDSTIYGNSAHATGGGIMTYSSGTMTLSNDTISGNTGSKGGGVFLASNTYLTMNNTIVAGNTAATDPDVDDTTATGSYDLIGNNTGLNLTGTNNNTTPTFVGLGTFSNYGGATNTIPLLPGSQAIDQGSNSVASAAGLTTDQRGDTRVVNGTVDIGAFESQGFTFSVASGNNQSVGLSSGFSPLVVSVTANNSVEPVNGGQVAYALTPAADGAAATLGSSPATIASGQASITATANAEAGAYTVTASASGASPATFTLKNLPGVTASSANLPANTTSLTIAGSGFDTTATNDSVTFSNGVTGTVSSATGSSLTVSLTGFSNVPAGTAVNATVTVNGASSSAVQVATVNPSVVTASLANVPDSNSTITINGAGFSTTGGNTVSFSTLGVVGSVTAATATQLTVTITTPPTALGNLTAVVTSNGISAAAAQVATEVNGTWTVTDSSVGAGSMSDVTLPYALAHSIGGDTITFAASMLNGNTITLSSVITLSKNLTITGQGNPNVAVSGNNAVQDFIVSSGITATISSLTVENGKTTTGPGAGIYNGGTLTLTSDTISGNSQSGSNGSYTSGGGVFNLGSLTVSNSNVSGNSGVYGGGIVNAGSASHTTVTNTTVTGNTAATSAGGIENYGGTLTVTNSIVSNNHALVTSPGGGINSYGGTTTLTGDTFTGNTAYYGAAVDNQEGATTTLTNDTIYGNSANADGGQGSGGGVDNQSGTVIMNFDTVTGNYGGFEGGGLATNGGAPVTLLNSIVAGNSAGTQDPNIGVESGGISTLAVANYDLFSNSTGFSITGGGTGDVYSTTPLLGALGSYGGTTQTVALLPGSPAINAGSNSGAPTTDQRGEPRPGFNGTVDIGAFESQGFTFGIVSGNNQSAGLSSSFSPLVVSVTAINSVEPVNGGQITYAVTPAADGAGATLASTTTIASGQASVTPTANAEAGSYTVTASASGASPISFTLKNLPGVTASSANLPVTATTLTILGAGFDTNTANDSVSFTNGGLTGTVSGATSTSLTISLTGLGSLTGGTAVDAAVTIDGATSSAVQVATAQPVVTASSTKLPVTATSLTITGFGFDANTAHDSVTFDNSVTGNVTGATSTSLTISLTGLSSLTGGTALHGTVTVDGASSGSAVQVATAAPVVASSSANLAASVTSFTIAGFGFDTNTAHDTVTFSNSVTGSVTAASSTSLTVSLIGLSSVAGGTSLSATVTVDGTTSGSAVQVATVTSAVTASSANIADSSTTITINGAGFSTTTSSDSVSFSSGVVGSVTSATATQLTVAVTAPPTSLGNLTATVTVGGISSAAVQVGTEVNGTWTVTDSSVSAGSFTDVTLPYALAHSIGGDTITFAASMLSGNTITLNSTLTVSKNLTITGQGAANTVISGNNAVEVFNVTSAATSASISSLTIEYGHIAGSGGGIANASGSLTLSNDTITGNTAITGTTGGGIYNKAGGTLTLSNSIVSDNSCIFAAGIGNQGVMMITNTTISQNSAGDSGAGIYNYAGTLTMSGSTVSNNLGFAGTFGGGGIVNLSNGPTAAHMTLTNDTIYGNSGHVSGGGINNDSGTLTLTNDTISGNTAGAKGGGISTASGQSTTLYNTIVAGNTASTSPDVNGTATGGNDLIGNSSGSTISGSNITNSTFLGLSAPGNYGGTTNTIALLPGSPAIDGGSNSLDGGATTDQRGDARIVNGTVDIGTFESDGFTISVSSGNNQSTNVGAAFGSPLVVSVTANNAVEPVNGGQVKFTVNPVSGAGATLATSPATVGSGQASVTATANATAGTYTASASASGASSATFTLTNNLISTSTTLTDNGPNPSVSGHAVSFTVNTTGVPNGATVDLDDASNSNSVVGSVTITGGAGSTTISSLSVGTHDIFAAYGGDPTHVSSQSSQVPQVVDAAVIFFNSVGYSSTQLQEAINVAEASGFNNPTITITGSSVGGVTVGAFTNGTSGTLTISGSGESITAPTGGGASTSNSALIDVAADVTIALSGLDITGASANPNLVYGLYATAGASVSVTNSTIEQIGNTSSQTGAVYGAYAVDGSTLTMSSSTVKYVGDETSSFGGVGVEIGNSTLSGANQLGFGSLTSVIVNNYQAAGIVIEGANGGTPSSATITSSTVTGIGLTANRARGIEVFSGATAAIQTTHVTANNDNTGSAESDGIEIYDAYTSTPITIVNCVVSNNDIDLYTDNDTSPTYTVNCTGDTFDAGGTLPNGSGVFEGEFGADVRDYGGPSINLSNSTLSNGQIGIYAQGAPMTITGTTISNNYAGPNCPYSAGGVNQEGSGGSAGFTLSNDIITGNTANHGGGGYQAQYGSYTTITNTVISNNVGPTGGGINAWGNGYLNISNSTIANNTAVLGGGIFEYGQFTFEAFDYALPINLSNCTISGNSAVDGGGIYNSNFSSSGGPALTGGSLTLSNCTLSGNTAGTSSGGGIINSGTLTVANSTIANNYAQKIGGGIVNYSPGTATLSNTIVADNTNSSGPDDVYTSGGVVTATYSLIGNNANSTIPSGGTNIVNPSSVGLGSLGSYGGPTQTISLLSTSPAAGAGEIVGGVTTDQRGISRPATNPDIGAFELETIAPSTTLLPVTATTLTINGSAFDTNATNDSVAFNDGVTGSITAATSTSLTVSLTGFISVTGGTALEATVTVDGVSSGSGVQVATAAPVVTASSANLAVTAASLTISGYGFDTNTASDSVSLSNGVTGVVSSATSTSLTVSLTGLGSLTGGTALNASVTVDGTSNGSSVQVAAVAPVVSPSTAYLPGNAVSLTISGYGFDTNTASDSVSLSNGVTGSVTGASGTSLTVSLTGLSTVAAGTALEASVTVDGVSSGSTVQVATVVPVVTLNGVSSPTDNNEPTFTGTAGTVAGDLSTITVNIYSGSGATGVPFETLTATASGGSYSVAATTALSPDGTYTAQASQSDSDSQTVTSSTTTFTVDTTAPTSSASSPAYNNTDSFTVSYTSSDALSGVTEVQVYVSGPTDGGTYSLAHTFTGSGLTSGSFTYTATEGDGSYEFETQATDAAGNVETTHASADTTTVEDTVAPTSSASSPAYNNTDSFTVSYTSSDATSGVSEVQVYVSGPTDGGTYSLAHTFTGSGLTSGSFAYTATEGDGSYELETQATDAAGNVETTHASADTTTVEDTVAPTSSASSPAYNNTDSFTVSYTSSDATSGVSEVQVYVSGPTDGGTYSLAHTFTGSGLTSGSFTYTATEGDGSYEFETQATDAAGNVETTHASADTTTVEDTVAPTSSASSPAYNNTDSFTVSYTSSDATSGVSEVQVFVSGPTDGGTYSLAHTFTGSGLTSGSFTYTATEGDGSYEFETQATDAVGNVETTHASADTTTVEDTVAPTSLASSPAYNNTNSFTVSYTSSDATSGVSEVQVYVSGPTDGGTYSLAHTFTGSGLTSGSFTYTATEGDGSYEFETQATDAAGNVETTHASADTTTVEDTVAPTVTLNSVTSPTSNTTPTFSGTAGTASGDLNTITVDVYSGSSATGSPVEVLTTTASAGSYSVAATAALSLGTYTAQASQSDAAGNTGTSTSSTFTVQSSITSTTTNLTDIGPSPSTSGQAVSYTVNTTGVPNGATIYLDDANQEDAQVGTVVITGGTGSTTISSLSVGTHEIFAVYGGDLTHASSQSGQVAQVVSNSVTTTTTSLTDNGPSPSVVGTAVSYTVSTTGVPNGSTVYLEDADHSNAVVGSVVVSGGTGSTTVSNLSIGSHSIFAVYTGAAGYTASQSTPALAQTVSPIAVTSVAVNGDFIAISDLSEASQTVTVTTDGLNGFTAGNQVVIAGETGAAAGYNGTWTILSASGDTFTYTNSATGLPTLTFNANGYAISTNTSSSLRGSQRSMVDSVVYTFNAPVNLTSNAVTLALKGGITVTGPNTMATGVANVNWTSLSGGKIWVMTFSSASGNTVTGHSIADGVYTLSLNSADVTAVAGGSTMTTTRATDTFYRLYADTNGQQRVSNADLLAFNNCYAQEAPSESYLAALDYNADGRVNNTDLLAFNNHYSAHWTGFTSTI